MADADFVQASRHGEAQRRIIRVAAEHPCKWKNRVVVRVRLALKSAYRLHAHHIRECTAQPRRLLRVVVYDHQFVLRSLARKAAVKFGHELCLALDVVELYALYPELFTLFEESAPVRRKPHLVHGGLPEPYPDRALFCVVNELFDLFERAAFRLCPVAPAVVREVVFISRLLREGVEFHYLFKAAAVLLVYKIRPRALARAYPVGVFVCFVIHGRCGVGYNVAVNELIERAAHGDYAPRSFPAFYKELVRVPQLRFESARAERAQSHAGVVLDVRFGYHYIYAFPGKLECGHA